MILPCRRECIKYPACVSKDVIRCDVLKQFYYFIKNQEDEAKEQLWKDFKILFPNLINFRTGKYRYAIVRKEPGDETFRPPYSHPDHAMRFRKMSKVSGMQT